ncbi:MAG TPA: tRNA preQ1(34) S-adenosylmethionine ribosyltransferase-isomerase QueA [Anaeromyxobacteraceae bacterium]|nr:tRNA preQ1(34) S-adenosylmethionine ribosyltransferase-isomerase QueA [Anaeromyxobacteraceae bacterium]
MELLAFDYELPEELIAQEPLPQRAASRLMVVGRGRGFVEDACFADLERLVARGDLLVFNDTSVIPARLVGRKASGGRCELLLVEPVAGDDQARWRALGHGSRRMHAGARLAFGGLSAVVVSHEGDGLVVVEFDRAGAELTAALGVEGRVPLPPYIRREPTPADRERYQTVYARVPGSVAAPTAGLHFTDELLARLAERGVERAAVTLHVGPGTFLPVRSADLSQHRMHEERFFVPEEAARAFAACRARGGRVVAVGTTAVRALESSVEGGRLRVGAGRTSLFIKPGYYFTAVDALVTNLHLPRSTLLMLASAFGGHEQVMRAYEEAVRRRYRFFSYGDAMFLC